MGSLDTLSIAAAFLPWKLPANKSNNLEEKIFHEISVMSARTVVHLCFAFMVASCVRRQFMSFALNVKNLSGHYKSVVYFLDFIYVYCCNGHCIFILRHTPIDFCRDMPYKRCVLEHVAKGQTLYAGNLGWMTSLSHVLLVLHWRLDRHFSTSFVCVGLLGLPKGVTFRTAVDWPGRMYFKKNVLPDYLFLEVLWSLFRCLSSSWLDARWLDG
jgi:hypothetical protein